MVSSIGSQVSMLAFPWLILAVTGSPVQAGLIAATRTLPYILFGLLAGALVDRWNRKRVMILCDVGRAIALGSIPIAFVLGHLTALQLYLVSFIEGTLFIFFGLAEAAALPRIVSPEQLSSATAQNEFIYSVSDLLGPSLSGILYSLGNAMPFLADAVSYGASVCSLVFISTELPAPGRSGMETGAINRVPTGPIDSEMDEGAINHAVPTAWHAVQDEVRLVVGESGQSEYGPSAPTGGQPGRKEREARIAAPRKLWLEIVEGMHWLWHHPVIRFLAVLMSVISLCSAGSVLIVLVLAQQQHASKFATGLIFAAGGIGSILGALIAGPLARKFSVGTLMITASWFWVLAWLPLAFAPNPFVLGMVLAAAFIVVPIHASVQYGYRLASIPDRLQGRVNSIYRIFLFGSQAGGLLLTGVLLQAIGPVFTVLVLFFPQCVLALAATLHRPLRHAPRLSEVRSS